MMQASSRCRREADSGVLELLSVSREAAFPAENVTKLTSEDIALRMMATPAFFERDAARLNERRRNIAEETEG
jgi:hypothetical protein